MNVKTMRPFLIGMLLSAAGVALFFYWQRQLRRMQSPGVVLLGRPDPPPVPQRSVDVVGEVTNAVAESLVGSMRDLQDRPAAKAGEQDLTRVKGIGAVYARRLNEAGIRTYAALAATPAAELVAIARLRAWQAAASENWIAQAAALAAEA